MMKISACRKWKKGFSMIDSCIALFIVSLISIGVLSFARQVSMDSIHLSDSVREFLFARENNEKQKSVHFI